MELERDMLEKLVLDRALGALSPEAARLLEAYGEMDGRVAALAREYEQTVGLARRALADEREPVVPPFPTERMRAAARTQRLWKITRNLSALAACVVLGLMVGTRWGAAPVAPAGASTALAVRGEDGRGAGAASAAARGGSFWSSRRIQEQAQAAGVGRPSRVWRSPVQMPQAGDAS